MPDGGAAAQRINRIGPARSRRVLALLPAGCLLENLESTGVFPEPTDGSGAPDAALDPKLDMDCRTRSNGRVAEPGSGTRLGSSAANSGTRTATNRDKGWSIRGA